MITVLFFAQFREIVGHSSVQIDYHSSLITVVDIVKALDQIATIQYTQKLDGKQVIVAINQEIATLHSAIHDGDEIAFFPPVSGG